MAKKQRFTKTRIALRVFAAGWRNRPMAVVGFFIGACMEVGGFLLSIFASAQLASLLAHYIAGGDTNGVWFWLWVDVGAVVMTSLGFWVMTWMKRLLFYRMTVWATAQFQRALSTMDIPDFYDEKVRNQINKAQNGYTWHIPSLNEGVLDLGYGVLRFLVTAIVVAQITWWLIPVIALFLLPTLYLNNRLAKVKWFVWDAEGDTHHVFWTLDWLIRQAKQQMELRSSQARHYVLDKISNLNKHFYKQQESEAAKPGWLMGPAALLEVGGTATGSILALQQFLSGAISLDRYFFVSGALLRIGGAINNIFGNLNRIQEPLLTAQDFFAIVDRQPAIVDKPHAVILPGNNPPTIEFENVDFTYPGHDKAVFKGLSFTINAGEHVAIVGENGAGKTTLIKLLMRFYVPTGGRILIDGVDLQDLAIESWYDRLATLFQQFNEYPFSVEENIFMARPEFAKDKVRLLEAAHFSGVDKFVGEYKHGWETVLNNSFKKGVEPSGGQWQRVALARAFFRHASVLILDEPTAAIDSKAEYDIFNNIFEHYQNKTAIIVSHRFSTVRRADTIIVVEHGKIMERGTHEELMKKAGLYHEMFTKQAEGYK